MLPELKRKASVGQTVRDVAHLFRVRPGLMLSLIVLGFTASLAEGVGISLFIPLLYTLAPEAAPEATSTFVNRLVEWSAGLDPAYRLPLLVGGIVAAITVKALFVFGYGAATGAVTSREGHRLRASVFNRLIGARYSFLEQTSYGRLLNGLATESWRATDALNVLIGLYISICTALVYLALMLVISWELTIMVVFGLALISWAARRAARRVDILGLEATEANKVLAQRISDGLAGFKQIRVFGREKYEQDRFRKTSSHVARTFWKLGVVGGLVSPIFEVLSAILIAAVLLFQLQSPEDLPALLVFLFVLYRLKPRVEQIDGARVRLSGLQAAVDEMKSLLAAPPAPDNTDGVRFERLDSDIRLDNVTFGYREGEPPALHGVTATIPAGRMTALVGPSGAGKTTILKLLLRLYDPDEGVVVVGETPLPTLRLSDWRQKLAVVSQDAFLFDATVAENIAYGREGASAAEIEDAARRAQAHDFIVRLPHGYETRVHERGVRLSGGQQQRIALARGLIRDPQILLLDEATNALDSLSERLVQDALEAFSNDRTVVVVAHRLSTIQRADHVIVVEDGAVAEEGTFESLLAHDRLFAQLYRAQGDLTLS